MAEKITLELAIETGKSAKNLGQLEEAAENLKDLLKKTDFGTKEFNELNQALKEVNREIKNTELNMEALDNEQVASELGSVAGAVGDVTAAFILLGGDEDSAMAETARRIETALGVTMAFKGTIEGVISFQKLWNNVLKKTAIVQGVLTTATAAWSFVTKGATIVTKALRLALLSLPFVAIGAAITAVIAYWDDLVEGVKSGLKWLGLYDDSSEKAAARQKARARQRKKEFEQEIKLLERRRNNEKRILDDQIANTERYIALEKAKGVDVTQMEEQLLKDKISNAEKDFWNVKFAETKKRKLIEDEIKKTEESLKSSYARASTAYRNSKNDELTELKLKLDATVTAEKDALKVIRVAKHDEAMAEAEAEKEKEEARKKRREERKKAEHDLHIAKLKEREEDTFDAEEKRNLLIQIEEDKLKHQLEVNKKKKRADRMTAEEIKLLEYNTQQAIDKIKEDFAKKELDRQIKLKIQEQNTLNELLKSVEDLENAHFNRMTENQERNQQIEINAIYDKYNAQIEALKARNESTAILEEAQAADIAEINKKYKKQEIADAQEVKNAKVQLALDGINAIMSLTSAFAKDNEASQRKAFEINKKLQIAQALIQTYQGVQAIFAARAASPETILFPAAPFIAAGIALATGLANVQNIRKQQFSGGSSGGSFGGGGGGVPGGGAAPSLQPVTNTSTLVPQDPQQVFVTETDITNTQNKVAVIEDQATIQ